MPLPKDARCPDARPRRFVQVHRHSTLGPDFSFVLASGPLPSGVTAGSDFYLSNVDVVHIGTATVGKLTFFNTAQGGGLEFDRSGGISFYPFNGAQLFTGSLAGPTF